MAEQSRPLGTWAGVGIVIASMIGAGVFLSAGFMAQDLGQGLILIAWSIGVLLAIAGARAYAELATIVPRSGGEYRFLSDLLHPALGYLAGWASLLIGFSAPIAIDALAAGAFLQSVAPGIDARATAIAMVYLRRIRSPGRLRTRPGVSAGCFRKQSVLYRVRLQRLDAAVYMGEEFKNPGVTMSIIAAVAFVSAMSAMMMAGSRAYAAMGPRWIVAGPLCGHAGRTTAGIRDSAGRCGIAHRPHAYVAERDSECGSCVPAVLGVDRVVAVCSAVHDQRLQTQHRRRDYRCV